VSNFHTELVERLNALVDETESDTDPAIWAVRACGTMVAIIGTEDIDMQTVRANLERLFVLAPDKIVAATVTMSELFQGENK
jgi:hypothetical protein